MSIHRRKLVRCGECGERFRRERALVQHVRAKKLPGGPKVLVRYRRGK